MPVQFQVADIPRILPEILLLVLGVLVIFSDIFEKWGSDEKAQLERIQSSGSLALIGLGMIFVIVLLQSGYVYTLPANAPDNFFTNIVRNLQAGGAQATPILGSFATDHLTIIGRLIFIGAAFLTVLLTLDYRPSNNPGEFYGLIIFSVAGMCLMSAASEFILAYLGVELTSIPLYILAGYFQYEKRSSEAGIKYFLFGAISSGILLYGMSLTYGFAASSLGDKIDGNNLTQFARIGQVANLAAAHSHLLILGMIFIVAGVGYKVAVVPFHGWSPDVYQGAPTPITAFVSTASKAAGFLLLYRMLTTTFPGLVGSATLVTRAGIEFGGWTGLLALLAFLTLIVGNLSALPQTNAKRLLAYSSIAHAGFLLMGLIAWASPQLGDKAMGTSALLYYLIVYTVTNIGSFGALAVISMAVGGDDVSDLNGLARRNLGLAVFFAVSVLSLAGIPPLSGFFAKFYAFMAAWQAGAQWLVIIGVIMTVVSLYYYLRLLRAMFIVAPTSTEPVPLTPAIRTALVVSTLLIILLGVYPNIVLPVISQVQTVAGR